MRRWGHRLTLVTPSHLLSGFHSSAQGSQVSRPWPWPGAAHSRVQTLGGCSVSGAEWPGPASQSEASIRASGPIRSGHSPPYWQRETGVSVPCRDQWVSRARLAWSESVPSQTQHGEALTSHHISQQEISIISTHADNTPAGSVNSEPRN